jgi:hypothetical protein
MTDSNPDLETILLQEQMTDNMLDMGFTEGEIKALFELPRIKKHKAEVKPAGKLQAAPRHTLAPVRPSQRYRPIVRSLSFEVELRARRKAKREAKKKAEMALTLVGLAVLGNLLESIKPVEPVHVPKPVNVPVPSNPDEIITDAEFRDIFD